MLKSFCPSYLYFFFFPSKYDPLITSWSGISPGHGSEIKTSQREIISGFQTEDSSSYTLLPRTRSTELCWRWEELHCLHHSWPAALKQTPFLHFKLAFRAWTLQSSWGTLLSQLEKGRLLQKKFQIPVKRHSNLIGFNIGYITKFSKTCPRNTYKSVHALVTRKKTSSTYTNNSLAVHPQGCAMCL